MTSPTAKAVWDAAVEEQQLRNATESARRVQDSFKVAPEGASGFVSLCLAELDAGVCLLQSDCFSSRETFLAEVRRLISEPTMPSRPVASIEGYRASQKQWLEFILIRYEQDT